MFKSLIVVALLALAGCSNLSPVSYNNMSADQIKAINSDKNIVLFCSNVNTFTTDVSNVFAVVDKATIINGKVIMDGSKCTFEVSTQNNAPAPTK